MPALGTILRRVGRIDEDDRDARDLCLVRQERSELEEGPTVQPIACVPAPSRSPFADALEVFESDPTTGALGGLDVLFRGAVVDVPFVAGLSGLVLDDPCGGSTGDDGPTFAAWWRLPGAVLRWSPYLRRRLVDLRPDICPPSLSVAMLMIPRSIPMKSVAGISVLVGDVHRHQQEPLAIEPEHEVRLSLGVGEPLGVVLPHDERHDDATFERQQADAVRALEAHGPLVVDIAAWGRKTGRIDLSRLYASQTFAMQRTAIWDDRPNRSRRSR